MFTQRVENMLEEHPSVGTGLPEIGIHPACFCAVQVQPVQPVPPLKKSSELDTLEERKAEMAQDPLRHQLSHSVKGCSTSEHRRPGSAFSSILAALAPTGP